MYIWHLQRHETASYEQLSAVVVVAPDAVYAMALAADRAGAEGPAVWFDETVVTCDAIGPAYDHVEAGVVCADEVEA